MNEPYDDPFEWEHGDLARAVVQLWTALNRLRESADEAINVLSDWEDAFWTPLPDSTLLLERSENARAMLSGSHADPMIDRQFPDPFYGPATGTASNSVGGIEP